MGLQKFLQLFIFLSVMAVEVLIDSAEPTVLLRFTRVPAPRSRFSTAIFRYSVQRLNGSNACKNNGCSISCEVPFAFFFMLDLRGLHSTDVHV